MMFYLIAICVFFSSLFQANSSDLFLETSSSLSDSAGASGSPVAAAAASSFLTEFSLTPKARSLLSGGDLTPGAVLEMLRPEPGVQEGLISGIFYNPDGSSIPESIRVLQDGGGSSTDALFLVQVRTNFLRERMGLPIIDGDDWQTKLVIKVLKSMGSIYPDGIRKVSLESIAMKQLYNLDKVKNNKKLASLGFLKNPTLPKMTFDESAYYYDSGAAFGGKHYFSIIHAARGMSFSKIWDEFLAGRVDLNGLLESAYAIGMALGAFHNVTHYVHGDFYWQNVFYDFKGKRVYFIDNESIANSIDGVKLVRDDFLRFYEHPLFYFTSNITECGINKYPFEPIRYLYQAFFDGYVAAYPETRQSELIPYIRGQISLFNEEVKGVVMPLATASGVPSEGERKLKKLLDSILSR